MVFPFEWRPKRAFALDDEVDRTQRLARRNELEIDELRSRLDHLERACRAMWAVAKRSGDTSDEALRKEFESIDLAAARAGECAAGDHARVCESCAKHVSCSHTACIYCGGNLALPEDATPLR